MPENVLVLLIDCRDQIRRVTDELEAGEISVDEWKEKVTRIITQHAMAAMMFGLDTEILNAEMQLVVSEQIRRQAQYLNNFGTEIADSTEWSDAWNARAEMYAESIAASYWYGFLDKGGNWQWHYEPEAQHCGDCIELNGQIHPAEWWRANHIPGDGNTECVTNCRCTLLPTGTTKEE